MIAALGLTSTLRAADESTLMERVQELPKTITGSDEAKSSDASLAHQDVQFIQQAAEKGLASLVIGLLAIEKGATDEIKKKGHSMVDEATAAAKELMELASRKNVFVPLDQIKLPAEEINRLASQGGKEFDSAFVLALFKQAQEVQRDLQSASAALGDQELRSFAEKLLSATGKQIDGLRKMAGDLGMNADWLESSPPAVGEAPLPEKDLPKSSPEPTIEPEPHGLSDPHAPMPNHGQPLGEESNPQPAL